MPGIYRFFCVLVVSSFAGAALAGSTEWSYDGDKAPDHWAALTPEFATCGSGKNQSPIDIKETFDAYLPTLDLTYPAASREVLNNGHTIQVNVDAGNRLQDSGRAFELKQFHFHAPSENRIGGQSFPMEMHLVHADQDGNLAVIGVMFEEGKSNPELEKLWQRMPTASGDAVPLQVKVSPDQLLPWNRDYYRYNGSLTTPPCSEGVEWFVLKQPITASHAQIERFHEVMHHANNRPVQPLNARLVVE